MTLNEFRAWLEGYSAAFTDGTPDAAQWAEIRRRLLLVEPFPAPTPLEPPWRPYWYQSTTASPHGVIYLTVGA